MGDFVSQATIDDGLTPVPDALGHDQTALALLQKTVFLPPGSVLAVQGSWGRGKTDVLTRIAAMVRSPTKSGIPEGLIVDALWINPWQYGTADLLTPLVLAMLARLPEPERRRDHSLRKIAVSLLRAGVNFGFKALGRSGTVPLLDLAADPVDRMLGAFFDAPGAGQDAERPDPDPVSVMGERFRQLAQKLLETKQTRPDGRLVVCVDDLDRCLPDRQVALLEAIRFLISAGAPVTFLIALDPTLARQAIITHYQTEAFDPDRYLDKMFDLRINLPSLGVKVGELVAHHLGRTMQAMGHTMKIGDAVEAIFGQRALSDLKSAAVRALNVPDLSNPRVVRRIFDRLYLLAVSRASQGNGPDGKPKGRLLALQGENEYGVLLVWLGICERFPAIRAAVQGGADKDRGDSFVTRLKVIQQAYTFDASLVTGTPLTSGTPPSEDEQPERSPFEAVLTIYRLPAPGAAPDLARLFSLLAPKNLGGWFDVVKEMDDALVAAGL
jgi:hypothetical protein